MKKEQIKKVEILETIIYDPFEGGTNDSPLEVSTVKVKVTTNKRELIQIWGLDTLVDRADAECIIDDYDDYTFSIRLGEMSRRLSLEALESDDFQYIIIKAAEVEALWRIEGANKFIENMKYLDTINESMKENFYL